MDEARLVSVAQRAKARIRGVTDFRLELVASPDGAGVSRGTLAGVAHEVPFALYGSWTDHLTVEWLCDHWKEIGAEVLPEIVLTGDTAVVLNGHQLRIAETQTGVTAKPRERVDPAEAYTAEEAERDLERVAGALMVEYGLGAALAHTEPWPDDPKPAASDGADVSPWRKQASLLLSKLHGWRRGAPASSAGHHHARRVFEDPTLDALAEAADPAMEAHARGPSDLQPPEPLKPGDVLVVNGAGSATRVDYTVEDAEADIALVAEPLAAYAQDTGTDASKAAEEARRDAARMLLKLTPWRAAVPVPSPGLAHVEQVAKRGER